MHNFIDLFCEWAHEAEAPDAFWEGTALWTIAAAAERKVWFDNGIDTLYPNLFMAFVGPPASHKSTTARKGVNLLKQVVGVNLAPNEITRQELYNELERSEKTFEHRGQITLHSSLSVMASEWDIFLGHKDDEFLKRLADFYDCEDFEYKTKHQGTNSVKNIFFNMLGCIQAPVLADTLPAHAIEGGFCSRTIFVVADGKRHEKQRPHFDEAIEKELIGILNKIHRTIGEMELSEAANSFEEQWYYELKKKEFLTQLPAFQGYCNRKPQHLIKLSMLMSLARTHGMSRTIEVIDMERALLWLNKIENQMVDTFAGFGLSQTSAVTYKVKKFIESAKSTTWNEVLKNFYLDTDAAGMRKVIETLTNAELIVCRNEGKIVKIEWREE